MMTGIKWFRASAVAAVVVLGSLMMAGKAEAATCELMSGPQSNGSFILDSSMIPVEHNFPFSISRLTGSAEAVGSILYSGLVSNYLNFGIQCDSVVSEGGHYVSARIESAPLGIWSGDIGQYSGKIYNTGLDGIGFVFKGHGGGASLDYNNLIAPFTAMHTWIGNGRGISGHILPSFQYYLIKTGPLSYGTIDGSLLPTISAGIKVENIDVVFYKVNFSGSISVNKPTCNATEPNKLVRMGTWHKRDFANVGDTSSWVDSSLTMICDDAFWGSGGTYDRDMNNLDPFTITEIDYATDNTNNTWAVRLTSSTGLIDSTQGIIALDTSNGDNATGVGIQISSSADAAGVVDLTTGWGGTIALGSSTFRIPIFARYIRTGDITPGSANGKVIYTVDYQ